MYQKEKATFRERDSGWIAAVPKGRGLDKMPFLPKFILRRLTFLDFFPGRQAKK